MAVKVQEKVPGSGNWYLVIHHNGRRVVRRVGDLRAAKVAKTQIEARLALDQPAFAPSRPAQPTLQTYFEQFVAGYLATAVKARTKETYLASFRNHILPALGNYELDQISRTQVKTFVASLVEKDLSKATIGIIIRQLCTVLNHAIEDGLITTNPASRMGQNYRNAKGPRKIEPLTADEVKVLLATALEHCPQHYPLFLTAIHTGMRSGEVAGLRWDDLDFDIRLITVQRQISGGQVQSTKTDRVRQVDMSDALAQALLDLRRQRQQEWLAKGRNQIPEWVFANRAGNPIEMHNLKNRYFYPCLKKAGLGRITFHTLRHTFATLLIQNGQSLAHVQAAMGHSSIRLTVDTYSHLVPGSNRAAVNRLPSL